MDIQYLLALQNLREGAGGFLAQFLEKMTFLGERSSVIVIMALVYWCLWKEFGSFLLMGWSGNRILNGLMKVTFCVYRPWIRDAAVVPYGDAISTAGGYSFPSGHTMNAASTFGGGAVRKDFPKILRIVLLLFVLLIGFSRNFLGVHTPQDVLVGAVLGLLVMWLTVRLLQWVEANPEKDWMVSCAGLGLCVIAAVYAVLKPYPADYDEAGKLLVDGAKMAADSLKGVGYSSGILLGWFLERRCVRFSTDVSTMRKLTRAAAGLLSYYAVALIVGVLLQSWLSGLTGTMASCFLQTFYVVFIFPWLCVRYERPERLERTAGKGGASGGRDAAANEKAAMSVQASAVGEADASANAASNRNPHNKNKGKNKKRRKK